MHRIGFDNDKYLRLQSEKIKERISSFGGKLYLEFGGKLFDDYHASRVLPGFQPDSKVTMLMQLKDQAEIVIVINSSDIEKNKQRGDLGITYDADVLRLIDSFHEIGLYVGSVVLTRYNSHSSVESFRKRLLSLGVKVYCHYPIPGYPTDVDYILSDEGLGKNEYIETERSLVIVTAPGPGSGKMATCLSQLYHDHKRGIRSGYAKFETFPVWNLPLKHPVNLAYEAATADLNDVNMIDPFHLEEYQETSVNYNRDIEIFPVLRTIFENILGECPYKSPTDMGVNMAGYCITDNDAVCQSADDEIIRRYYQAIVSNRQGHCSSEVIDKIKLLMNQANLTTGARPVAKAALDKSEQNNGTPAVAIELNNGTIITGKTGSLLGASAAALLNALKTLAGLPDELHLISPTIIEPIQNMKVAHLGNRNPRLHTNEVLIALSICAANDVNARAAIDQLSLLRHCEVHSTVILSEVDERVFKKLGMNVTSEGKYQIHKLYHQG